MAHSAQGVACRIAAVLVRGLTMGERALPAALGRRRLRSWRADGALAP